MEKFTITILGTSDFSSFAASFVFALIGIFLSLRLHAKKRNKADTETPYRFSAKFLMLDNLDRIASSVVLVFVALRFCKELVGVDLTMYFALLIGFGLDKISEGLKKASFKARA